MHRVTAILLGCALIVSQGYAAALHVHVYADHDHPEHHHGPAAHEHVTQPHAVDDAAVIGTCEPGRHAVSLVLGCATPPHFDLIVVACSTPTVVEPHAPARTVGAPTDVRVHGPPRRTQAPPRAPPYRSRLTI